MANILEVNRPNNKITLGTTGTVINIASHTASKLLSLDASKNLSSDSSLLTPTFTGLILSGTTAIGLDMSGGTFSTADIKLSSANILTDAWLGSDTNTFLGIDVAGSGNLDTGGLYNTAIGNTALKDITTGTGNTAGGWHAVGSVTTNNANTGIGFEALGNNTGASNTALGVYTGITGSGSNCVFIGSYAGRFETGSNKLFIDGLLRTNEADGRVKALMYGVFAATTTNQSLRFNAGVTITDGLVVAKTSGVGIKVDTATPTFGWRDLKGKITNSKGATKPSEITYREGITQFQFGEGDDAGLEYHIPHDYVPGTDIHLHVHWSHISGSVSGGNIVFTYEITYCKGHNQAAFPATVTGTITGTASTTQYKHIISEGQISISTGSGTQIDTDDLEPDGLILCRIEMTTNNMTGATPAPFIHEVDVHYQSTNLGTKQKAPPFYT